MMFIFHYFYNWSLGRTAWSLLVLSTVILGGFSLWFQHVLLLPPCVLCIYERCALIGIMAAGLMGVIAPSGYVTGCAIILWLISAVKGLQITYEHILLQFYPSPDQICDFFVKFPSWLPLDKLVPEIFRASGDCSVRQWDFLSFEVTQWLIVFFSLYLIIAIITSISRLLKRLFITI